MFNYVSDCNEEGCRRCCCSHVLCGPGGRELCVLIKHQDGDHGPVHPWCLIVRNVVGGDGQ